MKLLRALIENTLNKFINSGSAGDVNQTVVDLATDSTTVSATPALLMGMYVNTVLSAHILPIKDATAAVINIPASNAVGSVDLGNNGSGIRFNTSLIIDPDDTATGEVVVYWKPLI